MRDERSEGMKDLQRQKRVQKRMERLLGRPKKKNVEFRCGDDLTEEERIQCEKDAEDYLAIFED